MEVQYIRDINGNIAFAVVPIDIWENLASQTMSSYASEPAVEYAKIEKPFNMMDFYGTISIDMPNEQLFEELNQLRGEWDRDI
jgi:hypothetical protein